MNNKILLLIFSLFLGTGVIHAQNGSVSGRITDKNDIPLEFVSVSLKNTNRGTITDKNGRFILDKIPEGNQVFVFQIVGYIKKEIDVKVNQDEETLLPEVTLFEDVLKLNDVEVLSSRETNKFADKETDYAARMPLENLENPQVYSAVSKELLEEQVVFNINDATRNTPGAVPVIYPSGGLGITFRGFTTGVNARNGMETVSGRSSVDIANVERIEVLKGPSGTLFGASVSSFGGVVNLVTKKPHEIKKTEISYTAGSFGLNRLTADINTPLTKDNTVLFRLNTAINKQKSFLDYGFNNTFLIAPGLLYKASDKLTFTLDAELFNANSTRIRYDRYGTNSGITNPNDIQLDYRTSLFHDDANAKTSSSKVFLQAEYQLSDNWKSTTLFSFVEEDVDYSYQYYATWLSPTEATRTMGVWGPIYNNYVNIQENINGKFNTGSITHNILAGVNYRHQKVNANAKNTGADVVDTIDITTDFRALRKEDVDPYLIPGYWTGWNHGENHTISTYVSDVINLTDRLSTMLSLRLDHFNRKKMDGVEDYNQTALAPKLGLVYQVVKDQVSVFGNYMNGFQNTAPVNQPDGSQLTLNPIYAIQYEGGIKTEAFDEKLSSTLSYYNITIDNATRTNADGFTIQDGKQVSKGFDFELIANPITGLNIIAGYAYNDNRIVKAADESIEGNKATGAPENAINFWVSYKFQKTLPGLGVGFGSNYVDKAYKFSDNVFYSPSYSVFNATLFYEHPIWRFGLKLNNLTNQKYWDAYGVAQPPRNFVANLTLKF
ncbi:TonB-dependent receptor [Reichenbachiella sp. MALMAid0571]|uniref:TonB-dependent receptor n=1 Tax=Reichenbachiella sp. MALMAid0571 TaxID=3143939 RepID=UPI0032E01947